MIYRNATKPKYKCWVVQGEAGGCGYTLTELLEK